MNRNIKIETPARSIASDYAGNYKIENHGLINLERVYWNLPDAVLYEESIFNGEATVVEGGALVVLTGIRTDIANDDKYVVKESIHKDKINWGEYNKPLDNEKFSGIFSRMQAYLQGREVYVQDLYVGADTQYQLPIRVITESAWQSLFCRNMFEKPKTKEDYKNHVPEFTVIVSPNFKLDPRIDGTLTETGIIIDFSKRMAIICNTNYAGEIKKTLFSVMNYLKPLESVFPMHCSANVGKKGDVALFFGLSGAGKITLSADPERPLVGDDEFGWSDNGIFNFESGCYAKVIHVSPDEKPQIFACANRYGSILENVIFNPVTRIIDLKDNTITENTRISFPLEYIHNSLEERLVNEHPKNIIFLITDVLGVLPPIAQLDVNQALYHFISGYTSKVAGTEPGLAKEHEISFDACFGEPFLIHSPNVYADLLRDKIETHKPKLWLVNTGWVGGKLGVGKRINIELTRNILKAIHNCELEKVEYRTDKLFGFKVPVSCTNVPNEVLNPESSWNNKTEYWQKYDSLAARYIDNFKLYSTGISEEVINAGPKRFKK